MTEQHENPTAMKKRICDRLDALGQSHITAHLEQLNDAEQLGMLRQIDELDLSVLDPECADEQRGRFEPLYATTLAEIDRSRERFTKTGLEAIRAGKVGAVLLAGAYVPLFIMTSVENHDETTAFFAEHDYFGYSKAHIRFFRQEQLPTVDPDGKLMLMSRGVVATAPNGNGGWYASMENTGILHELRDSAIEWLNVFAVDNVLQSIADPCFIGAVIESGHVSGAKVVAKAAPDDRGDANKARTGRNTLLPLRRDPELPLPHRSA